MPRTPRASASSRGSDAARAASIARSSRARASPSPAFTYFDRTLQAEAALRIADALVAGGALVLGLHESLPAGVAGFEPWPGARCVLRKRLQPFREARKVRGV
jgi:hypothetical protein